MRDNMAQWIRQHPIKAFFHALGFFGLAMWPLLHFTGSLGNGNFFWFVMLPLALYLCASPLAMIFWFVRIVR